MKLTTNVTARIKNCKKKHLYVHALLINDMLRKGRTFRRTVAAKERI